MPGPFRGVWRRMEQRSGSKPSSQGIVTMKLLSTLTAVCTCLTAYTSVALAAETSADAATESADPSVSGMLPAAEQSTPSEAAADKEVSTSSEGAPKKEGREAKNAIYIDLAGPAVFYSVNYDRELIPDLSARIGISYISVGASAGGESAGVSYFAVPLTASYLGLGSRNNIFEVGGGGVYMSVDGDGLVEGGGGSAFLMTALAGYRHQPEDGGFVFRVGLSPMIVLGANFLPWGYMSFGAAF